MRSVAFPAWGQLHNGSRVKASILFSLQSYLLARYVMAERRVRFYQSELDDPTTGWDGEFLRQKYDDHRDRRNDMVWWSVIVLLYSVIDAYVDAHMAGFDREVEEVERFTWQVTPDGVGGAAAVLRTRF